MRRHGGQMPDGYVPPSASLIPPNRRPDTVMDLTGRHPDTVHLARYFEYEHLPPHLRSTSRNCAFLAEQMIQALPDGAELTAGLRHLLEAKDCFVRAALPPA